MNKHKLNLQEIHSLEFEMLKRFVSVCENNHLNYYLAGGTLLGAIRHKGFIPWDDDIDILMPRNDYDRFVEISKKISLGEYYHVSSFENNDLNYPFCKIFDTRTEIIKKYVNDDTEQSLWIDILPTDGLPDDNREVKAIFSKSLLARKLLKIKKSKTSQGTTTLKKIIKPILKFLLIPVSIKTIVSYIDKLSRTYSINDCLYVGGIAMGYGVNEKMPKKEFLNPVKVEFEGLIVNAPSCWDFYLKSLYGDYMQLPPEEDRVAHPMEIWIKY